MEVLIAIFFVLYLVSHCSCSRIREAAINLYTFNVMDYGAIGDGLTDDSQAFLKAWSMVCAMKNGAATLKVPPGKTFMLKPLQFSGQIDGSGSVWWNSCKVKSCSRPAALSIQNCNNLQLTGTRHLNSARNHMSINNSNHTHIFNVTITAPQDSPNTDGIDVSQSSYILIQRSTIATGDDCIAMKSGTSYVNITGITCGPGHGISVGSLGKKGTCQTVEHVHVNNCNFKGADNGMRIKTWPGGCGYARNIKFEHIVLTNIKNPIIIDQDYENTSEVQISGVTYRYVNGTSNSETAIILNCGAGAGCTDIFMDVVNITSTSSGSNVHASCNNAHGVAASTSPPVSCLSQ
ncbi:hypothetical protein AAZX31_14G041800 [Glycine max]